MSTYTQLLYQLVFSTKNRVPAITQENEKRLYTYMWEVLTNKKCHVCRIGGIEDHLHIITHIHPTVAISQLMKDLKVSTSIFIKEEKLFPAFKSWAIGYGAFTYNIEAKENLVNYVKNQREHHRKKSFREEYRELLDEHQIEFDEKYLL